MAAKPEQLEIITCSYRPDLARCQRLCQSVERYVPAHITHTLIVPARDVEHFKHLENSRRRVLPVQAVVPGHYRQLPLGDKFWVDHRGWPVRGWVMQQLVKLSVSRATHAELLLFADSDLQFIQPFDPRRVYRDGRLRLHRVPGAMNEGRHHQWHRRAGILLGEKPDYFGSDYVGQLITWRRSHLVALQSHIEAQLGRPWHTAVARSMDISEYTLYGAFVEHVMGEASHGHYYQAEELCHCCWFDHEAEALRDGRAALAPGAMALLVQSNLGLTPSGERAVLDGALTDAVLEVQA